MHFTNPAYVEEKQKKKRCEEVLFLLCHKPCRAHSPQHARHELKYRAAPEENMLQAAKYLRL